MKKNNIIYLIAHVLFCLLLIYWFYNNSIIRPRANLNPYKEFISAIIVLLLIYANYFILAPKLLLKNLYLQYILASLFLICISGVSELRMVKIDIYQCLKNSFTESEYRKYINFTLFTIILRNGGFYFFFTLLALYRNRTATTIKEKEALLKADGSVTFLPCNGKPIAFKMNNIIYFFQEKNYSNIYTTDGKHYTMYSSLSDFEAYLGNHCIRINRTHLVNYHNIINFSPDHLVVKDAKHGGVVSLYFYKTHPDLVYSRLQQMIPHLEKKTVEIIPNKEDFGGIKDETYDEKKKDGGINALILEEIGKKPGIHVHQLFEILKKEITLRTMERKLEQFKTTGKIEYRGSKKNGGYFVK